MFALTQFNEGCVRLCVNVCLLLCFACACSPSESTHLKIWMEVAGFITGSSPVSSFTICESKISAARPSVFKLSIREERGLFEWNI